MDHSHEIFCSKCGEVGPLFQLYSEDIYLKECQRLIQSALNLRYLSPDTKSQLTLFLEGLTPDVAKLTYLKTQIFLHYAEDGDKQAYTEALFRGAGTLMFTGAGLWGISAWLKSKTSEGSKTETALSVMGWIGISTLSWGVLVGLSAP